METIFGNSMATGKFTKDSNATLGMDDVDIENGDQNKNDVSDATASDIGTTSASKPKKAKTIDIDEERFLATFSRVGDNIAKAIEKVAAPLPPPPPPPSDDLPDDLYDVLNGLPGFDANHIASYFSHLVSNPHTGRAFYKLPTKFQMTCVSMFIAEKFLEK